MRYVLILGIVMLLWPAALPAQVVYPGNDLGQRPDWSREFMNGMIALRQQDIDGAMAHFVKCVEDAKKPEANCEYYLALMYNQKGDLINYRKYLKLAAEHGSHPAATILEMQMRFQ